jgi:glycosyltransferase involved in cell wall biosynthesis
LTTVPEISVVMPCFNASGSVARAVASIQAQTHRNWEMWAIDDGSTDDSADQIAAMADADPRIRLVRGHHQGVVGASNHGLSLAGAPFIARMDADDVSLPLRLERQLQALIEQPALGAVSCLTRFAGDPARAGGYAHHVTWANQALDPERIALNRFIDLPVPHPTLMFRRGLLAACGGYREGDFPEDYELVLRWISRGVRIGKVNEVLYDWHDPPRRLSRNDPRYAMDAFHRCKAPYLAHAIAASGCADRELWVWGGGRPARKCARPLEQAWKPAAGFIDIDPRKIGRLIQGRPVVSPAQLPPAGTAVIVSTVASRGAGDVIRDELARAGRIEGRDFWIAA